MHEKEAEETEETVSDDDLSVFMRFARQKLKQSIHDLWQDEKQAFRKACVQQNKEIAGVAYGELSTDVPTIIPFVTEDKKLSTTNAPLLHKVSSCPSLTLYVHYTPESIVDAFLREKALLLSPSDQERQEEPHSEPHSQEAMITVVSTVGFSATEQTAHQELCSSLAKKAIPEKTSPSLYQVDVRAAKNEDNSLLQAIQRQTLWGFVSCEDAKNNAKSLEKSENEAQKSKNNVHLWLADRATEAELRFLLAHQLAHVCLEVVYPIAAEQAVAATTVAMYPQEHDENTLTVVLQGLRADMAAIVSCWTEAATKRTKELLSKRRYLVSEGKGDSVNFRDMAKYLRCFPPSPCASASCGSVNGEVLFTAPATLTEGFELLERTSEKYGKDGNNLTDFTAHFMRKLLALADKTRCDFVYVVDEATLRLSRFREVIFEIDGAIPSLWLRIDGVGQAVHEASDIPLYLQRVMLYQSIEIFVAFQKSILHQWLMQASAAENYVAWLEVHGGFTLA